MKIPLKTRLTGHGLVLVSVVFLAFYSRLVCPFVNDLALPTLLVGLGYVIVFQLVVRELLLSNLQASERFSLPRRAFFVSVFSWILAGGLAFVIHHLRYPEFPIASHLKLMIGYWGLGAGLLSQLEYVIYERAMVDVPPSNRRSEKLALRLLEGFAVFTIIPALVMVLMVVRYIYEGLINPGVAGEIIFLSSYFVLVALSVAWLWGKTLREDTERIVNGLAQIEKGHFDQELLTRRSDELGLLSHGINRMAKGLALRERMREAFGRFVSPEVADRYINDYVKHGKTVELGGERKKVAILIADIRGFTPLAESLEPELLTKILNAYFSVTVDAIQSNHGMIDKFMGDAVMAVFGHQENGRNHALDAAHAAIDIRKALQNFNQQHVADNWPELNNGVGVHLGEVVAGYFGSKDRMEFTVIGSSVNLAARIEACCKPPNPPILFSTEMAIQVKHDINVREVGEFELKGISQAVTLYTPIDDA